MAGERPEFVLLAGPSGSGKTTFINRNPDAVPSNIVTPDAFLERFDHLSQREARVQSIALADAQRAELIAHKQSFAQETLLADEAKIGLLTEMRDQGYKTRLVYMALEDPQDNEDRVRNRIEQGGNFVPPEIVQKDYHLSLGNLPKAMLVADMTEIYDNSGATHVAVATVEQGQVTALAQDQPQWVQRVFPDGIQAYLDQAQQAQQGVDKHRQRGLDLDRD